MVENLTVLKKRHIKYWLAASASLMTFVVYFASLNNEFVSLDDADYIINNPHIRSIDLNFIRWVFLNFYASNWHPLTWISHSLDYAIWGINPIGHHLTNNIIHAINTSVVVVLVIRLLDVYATKVKKDGPATFLNEKSILIAGVTTGLLFGLHPVHVESVAWVSERKDLLCALFFLLSILAYAKYVSFAEMETAQKKGISGFFNKHYLFSLCFFTLALLSKPMAVSLPFVLMILDWHPFKRIHNVKDIWSIFFEKIPFFSLSLVSSILTILAQKSSGAVISLEFMPLSTRLLVAPKALISYLLSMIFPSDLSPFYPYPPNPSFFSLEYISSTVLVIGFTAFVVTAAKKERLWLASWAYYVVTLLPVLGIVQVGFQARADRYTYLPSLGPFLIISLALAWVAGNVYTVKDRNNRRKLFALVTAFFLFGTLSYLSVNQITIWQNNFTLFNYIIEKTPPGVGIYLAYATRGALYDQMGQLDKAVDDYNKAIALNQNDSQVFVNRGLVFLKLGQAQRAIADFNRACELGNFFGCNAPRYLKIKSGTQKE